MQPRLHSYEHKTDEQARVVTHTDTRSPCPFKVNIGCIWAFEQMTDAFLK